MGGATSGDRTRVVLVTGASSGIGRACALGLAQEGYRVFATTRQSPEVVQTNLRKELSPDEQLEVLEVDVDDSTSVSSAVAQVVRRGGSIDALVNCAGFGIGGAVEDTDDDEARAIFETNVFGMLRVCRAVLPAMRTQGGGTIVNISSIGGRIGLPFQGLYSATKFAVEGLTEALQMEVHGFGIRAVLVEPGDFATGFTHHRRPTRRAQAGAYAAAYRAALAVVERDERGGATPDAVARTVSRILCARSPRLRYMVGPLVQRTAVRLKGILPSKGFSWALRRYYRIDASVDTHSRETHGPV